MSALGQFMRVFPLDVLPGHKTLRWAVLDRHDGDLGLIEWDTHWRQYVFVPATAQFSAGCLADLTTFLNEHRSDRVPPSLPKGKKE